MVNEGKPPVKLLTMNCIDFLPFGTYLRPIQKMAKGGTLAQQIDDALGVNKTRSATSDDRQAMYRLVDMMSPRQDLDYQLSVLGATPGERKKFKSLFGKKLTQAMKKSERGSSRSDLKLSYMADPNDPKVLLIEIRGGVSRNEIATAVDMVREQMPPAGFLVKVKNRMSRKALKEIYKKRPPAKAPTKAELRAIVKRNAALKADMEAFFTKYREYRFSQVGNAEVLLNVNKLVTRLGQLNKQIEKHLKAR